MGRKKKQPCTCGHCPACMTAATYVIGHTFAGIPPPPTHTSIVNTSSTSGMVAWPGHTPVMVPPGATLTVSGSTYTIDLAEPLPDTDPDGPPDVYGAIRGYRTWNRRNGLSSTGIDYTWTDGEQKAICGVGADSWAWNSHPAPALACGCGFYAFYHPSGVKTVFGIGHMSLVDPFGVIEAWGLIVEHEDGFRAQHAKILAVSSSSATARAMIKARYPGVKLYSSPEALLSDYPPPDGKGK